MPQCEAVVHVSWELPFALRLSSRAFFIWEPEYGVAVFDPRPRVGDLTWQRSSSVLPADTLYTDLGPPNEHAFPDREYLVTSLLQSGRELPTAKLTSGSAGGFVEPRAYTLANLFLCLQTRSTYDSPAVMERAGEALNNFVDVYRFVTMDPLIRSLRVDKDCYYTMLSVADVPLDSQALPAQAVLQNIGNLGFGHILGVNCAHKIGLNSFDDLFPGDPLPDANFQLLLQLTGAPHHLELFHQLIFSAIRRLKRHEEALAVLDAQSAFEALVALLVREELQRQGLSSTDIETQLSYSGPLGTLQRRLERLDRVAASLAPGSAGGRPPAFLNSPTEYNWRRDLYKLRNRIVHEGLRTVPFQDAKRGIVAGLHAVHAIQALHPAFNRPLTWSGPALDLLHIQESAGRLSRLFET